jgi:hypothetical protein
MTNIWYVIMIQRQITNHKSNDLLMLVGGTSVLLKST